MTLDQLKEHVEAAYKWAQDRGLGVEEASFVFGAAKHALVRHNEIDLKILVKEVTGGDA